MPSNTAAPVIPARPVQLAGADPVTVTATVVSVQRRDEPGIVGRTVGLDAILHVLFPGDHAPNRLSLSRLIGEPFWLQDSHIGPNGVPHFVHGFGSRTVRKHGVPSELEALLDEAAHARGLAAEIGPDIPLRFAANPDDPGEHT